MLILSELPHGDACPYFGLRSTHLILLLHLRQRFSGAIVLLPYRYFSLVHRWNSVKMILYIRPALRVRSSSSRAIMLH